MQEFCQHFPFFSTHPEIVYLDSASTTQKPFEVINVVNNYLQKVANPGRSEFGLSQIYNGEIEITREVLAKFLHTVASNIAFTTGATDSMNKFVRSISNTELEDGTEILLASTDHKSTILPWVELTKRWSSKGVNVKIIQYKTSPYTGLIDIDDLVSKVTDKTKFAILTHASNASGAVNDIAKITRSLSSKVITVLDMAQTVGHLDVDLEKIGVDVGVFSGHKMFALESVGCLYINHRLHSLIQQVDFGGGMQSNQFPYSFELGTKNTVGILSLKAAVEFINKAGIENISTHINELSQYLLKAMNRIKHTIEFEPGIAYDKNLNNTGILAFNLIDHEQSKVNFYLAKGNINIRNGDHCRNQDPSLRISLHCYNSFSDIDKLISVLDKIS